MSYVLVIETQSLYGTAAPKAISSVDASYLLARQPERTKKTQHQQEAATVHICAATLAAFIANIISILAFCSDSRGVKTDAVAAASDPRRLFGDMQRLLLEPFLDIEATGPIVSTFLRD